MKEMEFSGKTVEDALTEALVQLGMTSDQVEYEVIEKGSTGFLGFNSKQATIRVKAKGTSESEALESEDSETETLAKETFETKTSETKTSEKVNTAKEKTSKANISKSTSAGTGSGADENLSTEEKVRKFLDQVFEAMHMEVDIQFPEADEENTVSVNLAGDDMGVLIGKRGQTLDALQYLTNLAVNKNTDTYTRIKMDTENYRERRKETLENLARNLAYKVKRTKKPMKLEPMNPFERRVIHCALQGDRYVETHSEGEEPYRYVVITLKK